MQQSQLVNKVNVVWTIAVWIWTARKIISIILLVVSLAYLLWAELLEQRQYMRNQFTQETIQLSILEASFKQAGDAVFSGPSRDGRSITVELAETLYANAQKLQSDLNSFSQPNAELNVLRNAYAGAITDLLGALNLFEPGEVGTIRVLESLSKVDLAGTAYRNAADAYKNSFWQTFLSAF